VVPVARMTHHPLWIVVSTMGWARAVRIYRKSYFAIGRPSPRL
jgi:hypothetical protein